MNKAVEHGIANTIDSVQERLARYSSDLEYGALPQAVVHAAKVRIIDTLGALMGGFFGPPCQMGRNLAARSPDPDGATVIGTRIKTAADMAAFVNATAARYVEMNDVYHWPGSSGGHPSDVIMPLLAVAEQVGASGRDLITSVVLAYEIYLRFSDAVAHSGFDQANFSSLGVAAGSAKLMGMTALQLSHAISMAAVSSNILGQVRTGHLSMWKAVASGQAGRAGVFAAQLAREGMEGPHLPFEGKQGWCNHVSRVPITLATMGGADTPFKIRDVLIKQRSSCATTISSILAAEHAAVKLRNRSETVKHVLVEVYEKAKVNMGTGEHHWNPQSRETADHSIPYVVAATLLDGTVTPRQFDDAHLQSRSLRALLVKIEVVANDEFTHAYERLPVLHRTRVTVFMADGERIIGESGGDKGDLSNPKSDSEIEDKFRGMAQEYLGATRVRALLDRLWNLEHVQNVAELPPALVLA